MQSLSIAWLPYGDRNTACARLRAFEIAAALESFHQVRNHFEPYGLTSQPPDVLVVQGIYSPQVLALVRKLSEAGTRPYLDLCDPVWLQEFPHPGKDWNLAEAMSLFKAVLVPTVSLGVDLLTAWPNVEHHTVQDAIEPSALAIESSPALRGESRNMLRIGWIGNLFNTPHLEIAAAALEALARDVPLVLRVITRAASRLVLAMPNVPVEYVPWELATAAVRLAECDFAVLPLELNRFTRGKSPNRLQFCMALGVPAVVSPLQSYKDIVTRHGPVALVASREHEWERHLRALCNQETRHRIALHARNIIRTHYTPRQIAAQWFSTLRGESNHA